MVVIWCNLVSVATKRRRWAPTGRLGVANEKQFNSMSTLGNTVRPPEPPSPRRAGKPSALVALLGSALRFGKRRRANQPPVSRANESNWRPALEAFTFTADYQP
jgi:hypothetical protein